MPRVPRIREERIQERPLPAAPTPIGAPLEAFGGGPAAEAIFRQIGGIAADIQEIAEKERQNVNQMQLDDLKNRWTEQEIPTRNTFLQTKARSGSDDSVQLALDQSIKNMKDFGEIEDREISDQQVADAYRRFVNSRINSFNAIGQPHVFKQRIVADTNNQNLIMQNAMKNVVDFANLDPAQSEVQIATVLQETELSIKEFGERNNLSEKEITARIENFRSTATRAVINARASLQNDLSAKEYFTLHKKDLKGKDLTKATILVQETSTLGAMQRAEEEIMARDDLTERQKIELGRRMGGEISRRAKDLLPKRIFGRIKENDILKAREQEDLYEQIRSVQLQNPGIAPNEAILMVKPDALHDPDLLTNRQKLNITKAALVPEFNDNLAWLEFLELVEDPIKLADQPRSEFEEVWHKLDAIHRSRAERERLRAKRFVAQARAVSKKGGPKQQWQSLHTDKEMIINALVDAQIANFNTSDTATNIRSRRNRKKAKIYKEWVDKVNDAFGAHFTQFDKNPNDAEKQKIIDRLILREMQVEVEVPGSNPLVPIKSLTASQFKNLVAEFEKVPARSVDNIVLVAKKFGISLNAENEKDQIKITRAFIAAIRFGRLPGTDKMIENILRGIEFDDLRLLRTIKEAPLFIRRAIEEAQRIFGKK